jgi:hypothetical protein
MLSCICEKQNNKNLASLRLFLHKLGGIRSQICPAPQNLFLLFLRFASEILASLQHCNVHVS